LFSEDVIVQLLEAVSS